MTFVTNAYHQLVHDMVSSGVVLDEGMNYFDARMSRHYPTVEIRITDVCLTPENSVLLAGITRALVHYRSAAVAGGRPAGKRAGGPAEARRVEGQLPADPAQLP